MVVMVTTGLSRGFAETAVVARAEGEHAESDEEVGEYHCEEEIYEDEGCVEGCCGNGIGGCDCEVW